jgi:hypothetical protein
MLRTLYTCAAALSLFALTPRVRADEIRLKDGSKIIGNVVGIEDGAFRVETAYGFAMVRKDSIAEIIPTSPAEAKPAAQKSAPGKPSDEDAAPAASKPVTSATAKPASAASTPSKTQPSPGKLVEAAEPKSQPAPVKPASYVGAKPQPAAAASLQQPTSPQSAPAQSTAKQLAPPSMAVPASSAPASLPAPASASPPVSATPVAATALAATPTAPAVAVAAPAPAPPPVPVPVREVVRGNLYINQTYGFQMFRPPDWQPIIAARAALPNAVAALGTSDQSTLLIIGRDRAHDSLDAESAATGKLVEEVYENYRPMPPQRIMVAGAPAIERQFRGEADKREWSVFLVTLDREGDVFTILAMTDANSDLVQIQENVIAKSIASLQFNTPSDPASPATPHT